MELLTAVFSRLLSMALMALPVMGVVLAVRLALTRAPRKYRYALWLVVGFRLLCPVSLRGFLSIFNLPGLYDLAEATGSVDGGVVTALPPVAAAMAPASPAANAPVLVSPGISGTVENTLPTLTETAGLTQGELLLRAASVVWLLGLLAVLAVGIVSLVRLRRRLAGAVWCGGEVWESDAVPTPFVLGFFRPRIYIPPHLTGTERTCVLIHERHHIRRRDPWWKLLAWCILAVYWWDPAVWLCWVLFCRDMEMSCDEAVLSALGDQVKRGYSLSLVANAAARPVPAALAFGEHDAARRVKNVLKWKKETPRVAFLAVAAVLLVVTVCLNGATEQPDEGYVRGLEGEQTAWSLDYRFPDDTRSYVFYMEIYRYGQLQERRSMVMDGMEENREGIGQQSGTFRLEVFREGDKTGMTFSSGTLPSLLTDAAECAQLTHWRYLRGEAPLTLGSSAAVAVAYASPEGDSAISTGALNREDLTASLERYPVSVVLRLAVSRQMVGALVERIESGVIDLPAALYALRLDHALEGRLPDLPMGETLDQDLSGVRTILETLGVPELERCTLELGRDTRLDHAGLRTLRVYCQDPADREQYLNAMTTASLLVPALVGDVDQVMTGYSNGNGRDWVTIYSQDGPNDLNEVAGELGYQDIHDLGKTLPGIQALVDWLWEEDLPAVSAAETLAARLWVLRDDPQMELENLLLDEGIPHVEGAASWIPINHRSISRTADDTLSFYFDDPSATAEGVRQAMEKKAMVLLAVREDLTKVTWKWTPEGTDVPALSRQLTETEADALLVAAGFSEGIKAMGASPAALAALLQWLDSWAGASTVEGTATRLWALSRGSGRYDAVREVVYRGPWAVPEMEGQCSAILNMEEISFQLMFMPSDPAALDAAMERSALVALYLLPWVEEVRWTYPGPDGAVERRVYGWEPKGEADLAALSAASGYDLARFHQSEEGLAVLLAALAEMDTPAAQAQLLYARARIQTAEEMAEELVLRGPWGDSSLAGTLHASRADGRLILQFTREGAWEQAMQQEQLARSGVVLLALYPDLQEVRAWSAYGESYTWVTRETAARSLPDGKSIGDYGASPETLEELLTALERLYSGTDYAA